MAMHESTEEAGTPSAESSQKWMRAASLDDVPEDGGGHSFKIEGLDIALFHWDQKVYAVENACPHLGFPLAEGVVQDGTVICGWHGWRVRLDDGGCWGNTGMARTYPCEVRGTEIYVAIPELP